MSSSSSVLYLFVSTTPLLAVYIYFIFQALDRPRVVSELFENVNLDDDMNNNIDVDAPVVVSLRSILNTFLVTYVVWSSLAAHLLFFVPKRRTLIQNYVNHGEATTVIGDVCYDSPRLCDKQRDTAYVTYKLPEDDHKFVQKKVRTYHPYHREKVAIVLLPGFPLSGLPLEDVKQDLMSHQSDNNSKDKIIKIVVICSFWMLFCLTASLFVIHQIKVVANVMVEFGGENDDEEYDTDLAWSLFWIFNCVIMPIFAFGGTFIQWIIYRHWLLKGGSIVLEPTKVPPRLVQPESLYDDNQGGFSCF